MLSSNVSIFASDGPSRRGSLQKAGIIVGVAIAVILIAVIAIGVAPYLYRKWKQVDKGYKLTNDKTGII